MKVDGLAGDLILSGDGSERFSVGETQFDFVYLLRSEEALATALVVCVPLTSKGYAFGLPFSYQSPFKLSDRSKDIEIQVLCGVGIISVEVHSFFDKPNAYLSGEQFLDDIEKVTERTSKAVYAMDDQSVSVSEIFQTGLELRAVCVFATTFVLKDLIQFNAVELSVGILVYGGNSDISYLLTVHRIFLSA